MEKNFIVIGEKEREKYWKNGYFESLAKRSGGVVLMICGAIFVIMSLPIFWLASLITEDVLNGEGDTGTTIFFWLLALAFFALGAFIIRFGFKRKVMSAEDWIKKSAKISDYPESVIRDFSAQAVSPGSIYFILEDLCGGFLTRDYILFANLLKLCVIRRSDISGAYLVNLPDTVSVGNKIKLSSTINVAIFSNHKTYIASHTKQKYGEQLITMLKETHPDIDTAGGRMLSDKEYDDMVSATRV